MDDASGEMPGAFDLRAGDGVERLRMDGEPTEAERRGGKGAVRGRWGGAAQGGDAAAELQQPAEQRQADA